MAANIITSSVQINAPIQQVWDILADFEQYHVWNPFTPKIEIKPVEGTTVVLHVRMRPESRKIIRQKETLQYWKEGEQMNWGIENSWWIRTVRIQKLTKINDHCTEYFTSDAFEGLLTKLVLWLYGSKIQQGFDAVAKNLKQFAEQQIG